MGKNRSVTYWSHSFYYIWAASRLNHQNGMSAQRRLRSTWASAQSDQYLLSTWRKLRSLAIIRAHSEASDQTGQMTRLFWVFAWCKGHFLDFVMRRLILLCLPCVNNTDFCYFKAFYFLKLPEKTRVFMYPCTCMLVSVYYVILIPLSFTTVDASPCSYSLLVGLRGDVRVVYLMANGYADIYKDKRRKHLRTHTMSNRRSIITTRLKLFRISLLSTEPALSTVAVKPKITAFKTPSNNGKCYYWYCILRWLTWQLYLAIHSVSSKYM